MIQKLEDNTLVLNKEKVKQKYLSMILIYLLQQ